MPYAKEHGVPLPPDEEIRLQRNLDLIRQSLEGSVHRASWSDGQAISIEGAIEYALTHSG